MMILFRLFWRHIRRHPGSSALMALLIAMLSALWVAEPVYTAYAVDQLLLRAQGGDVDLVMLFAIWGVLFVAISICQALEKYVQWKYVMLAELELYNDIYSHTLKLPVSFHADQKTGEAMRMIDEGSGEFGSLFRIIIDLVPSSLASIAFFILSWQLQPMLAMVLLVTVVIYFAAVLLGTRRTARLQDEANKEWVKPGGRAYDAVMNIFSVKSSGRENDEVGLVQGMLQSVMDKQLLVNRSWAFLEALNFFMLARILLIAGGVMFFAEGVLSLGGITFFQSSFFRVLTPFEILANALPQWSKSLSKVRMAAGLTARAAEDGLQPGRRTITDLKGEITFDNVSFRYQKKDTPITEQPAKDHGQAHETCPECQGEISPGIEHEHVQLPEGEAPVVIPNAAISGLSLRIKAGEHVALVGQSGAGKSTVATLLNRFYDVTSGAILIDGANLKELDLPWWRRQVGLVLQENIMFNASVLENIRYSRPGATMADVEDAAKRAAAHEFINKLSDGYDTEIGERGVKLSGGQRQRLAIARAILKNPKVVILDEATSALDSLTERAVQQGIASLLEGRTAVVIAHRLSTVRAMDRIAVMEAGKLIACAPHDELMKTCETYRRMVELQREGVLAE
ncbi:MAG: ABC transporter ATP-binding protein [Candidatus Peribacteraceae bacterium]|nr:ABC transporter ATP-binding protein [Candidatus Peribacteraceae bacterium]